MKCIFSFIIFLFYVNTLFAGSYNMFTAGSLVDKINQFRSAPINFIKKNSDCNIDLKSVFNTWADKEIQWLSGSLPYLDNDICLENLAKEHLETIFNNKKIAHIDYNTLECDNIFEGESLIGFAFQNYTDITKVEDIFANYLIKNAIFLNDAESAPVIFPYERAGGAILELQLEVNGITYNVYLVDIIYAISKTKYNNDVYGRIFYNDIKGLKVEVLDFSDKIITTFSPNPDGTFNILLPDEGIYKFVFKSGNNIISEKDINYNFKDVLNIDLLIDN